MTAEKKGIFARPSGLLIAAFVGMVLLNAVLWSGMASETLLLRHQLFYISLREYFYYILLLDAVVAFYIFSDLILSWDERPLGFRRFHLFVAASAVMLVLLKFLAFVFGYLLPFSL